MADGFIYHVRKLREKAKAYAKEMAYKDWVDERDSYVEKHRVKSVNDFKSIDEVNKFLDSPKDEAKIKEEIEKLTLALEMHGKG